MWSAIILDWASKEHVFELELTSETLELSIFSNATINRKLGAEMLREILNEMVASGTIASGAHMLIYLLTFCR